MTSVLGGATCTLGGKERMKSSIGRLVSIFAGLSIILVIPTSSPAQAQARSIEVDFSKVTGIIRPLNGVNGGPIVTRGAFDLSPYFRQLGIKHIRLHDVPWMYENAIDINYVFPRFEADINDPQSYDFSLTDYYLKSVLSLGVEVTFRLGYSAEWEFHPPIHNAPPKDFSKWAAICAHIVQHYNQGWANGHHYNIKYWEIWNESDIPQFWTGTLDQYNTLYDLTSRGIKRVDPSIKVGGPTLASHLEFLEGFLKYCAEHKPPLDFVPWHIYASQPGDIVSRAGRIQGLLDKYGFSKVESVLDEWNYAGTICHYPDDDPMCRREIFQEQMGGPIGAAFDASVFIGLQDSTVAIADFYQGTNLFWGGLFDEFGVPLKPYFAFKAIRQLMATSERVTTSGSDAKGFAVIAGLSVEKSQATILISNFGSQDKRYSISLRGLPWKTASLSETYAVDSRHNLDLVKSESLTAETDSVIVDVQIPSVCLIQLKALQ